MFARRIWAGSRERTRILQGRTQRKKAFPARLLSARKACSVSQVRKALRMAVGGLAIVRRWASRAVIRPLDRRLVRRRGVRIRRRGLLRRRRDRFTDHLAALRRSDLGNHLVLRGAGHRAIAAAAVAAAAITTAAITAAAQVGAAGTAPLPASAAIARIAAGRLAVPPVVERRPASAAVAAPRVPLTAMTATAPRRDA
jgi:hypothetical protein